MSRAGAIWAQGSIAELEEREQRSNVAVVREPKQSSTKKSPKRLVLHSLLRPQRPLLLTRPPSSPSSSPPRMPRQHRLLGLQTRCHHPASVPASLCLVALPFRRHGVKGTRFAKKEEALREDEGRAVQLKVWVTHGFVLGDGVRLWNGMTCGGVSRAGRANQDDGSPQGRACRTSLLLLEGQTTSPVVTLHVQRLHY